MTDAAGVNARARTLLGQSGSGERVRHQLDEAVAESAAVLDDDVLLAIAAMPHTGSTPAALLQTGHAAVDAYDATGRTALLALAAPRLEAAAAELDQGGPEYADTVMLLSNVCRALAVASEDDEDLTRALRWAKKSTQLSKDDPRAWASAARAWKVSFDFTDDIDALRQALDCLDTGLALADVTDAHYAELASVKGAVLFIWYSATDDWALLARAAEASRLAVDTADPDDPELAYYQTNVCVMVRLIGEVNADTTLLNEAVLAGEAACTPRDTAEPGHLHALYDAYVARFQLSSDATDLDSAVQIAEQAAAASVDSPQLYEWSCIYASRAHRLRYAIGADTADLRACVDFARRAVESHTPPTPLALDGLAIALATRFDHDNDDRDLDEALTAARRATQATSEAEPSFVVTLANILHTAYEHRDSVNDLDEAITLLQGLTGSADAETNSIAWSNLGSFLTTRFEDQHDRDDLEASLAALSHAAAQTGLNDPGRAACLSNLSNAYLTRFEIDGVAEDLDLGIGIAVQAWEATAVGAEDRVGVLSNLTLALRTRFDAFGDMADVDACLAAGAVALARMGDDDVLRAAHVLALLAGARRSRYSVSGDPEDLQWACAAARIAVDHTPDESRFLASRLTTLAACLLSIFESSGDAASLDQAIDLGQSALNDADGTTAGAVATNLSNAHLSRYELRGWRSDIDAAVSASLRSVDHTPPASPFLPGRLSNLCNALRASATARSDTAVLDDAIAAGRQSVDHPDPRDPEIAGYWSNLALALSDRFDITDDANALDDSIAALRNAVGLVIAGHPSALLYRTNLAIALRQRFDNGGPETDINEAITLLSDAAVTVSPSHSHFAAVWLALGNARHSRFLAAGDQADFVAAQDAWERAARSLANAGTRLTAAESLAVSAADTGDWTRSATAFRHAIELVPVVAWHGLDRRGREEALSNLSPLASSACAVAIAAQDYAAALENLEAGRSVLWKQVLDLRRDFTAVEAHDRALADRLRQLSRLLDA
ncbi:MULTISPECIES: hypothetical protein [unclassified Mycolicibacterium]|uniref:hypothetical protein n=1 Tax=unclassified Mycolicibacterium TaxID=2636767 RepID=UPI002EDB094E